MDFFLSFFRNLRQVRLTPRISHVILSQEESKVLVNSVVFALFCISYIILEIDLGIDGSINPVNKCQVEKQSEH